MPNRILKESICTSCEVDTLTAEEERMFYRLLVSCDDFGRLDAREPILRAKCFPLKVDRIKSSDIEKWLKKLAAVGLIVLYEVEGKRYLQFKTWDKHQQRRAKHSKYPAPDEHMISDDINCNQLQSNVTEESRIEESRNENAEQTFEYLWSLYPKKKGKGSVSDTQKKKIHKIGIDEMTRCVERYRKATTGTKEQFLQYGSTFFNSGYIDYLDENFNQKNSNKETRVGVMESDSDLGPREEVWM